MKLSQLLEVLHNSQNMQIYLPNGAMVPQHFHVTEVGHVTKSFIDCGGTLRKEDSISIQLWSATDYDHRLDPKKLIKILTATISQLELPDADIVVEFQGNTIEKYGMDHDGDRFLLTKTVTACLALDQCGITVEKPKVKLSDINSCTPGGGCC